MSPVIPRFALDNERSDGGAHVINVRGEIHMSTAPGLQRGLTEAIERGHRAIVLDLSGVEFIDSTGLSVLLNGLRQVTAQQGRMALVCANPTVLRLFEITSLDQTFDIFSGRDAACEHVTQSGSGASAGGAP